jgi:hypothetical protein
MTPRNTILVQGHAQEQGSVAIGAAITPGMLVKLVATGVSKYTVGTVGPVAFVRENHERLGHSIADDVLQNDSCTVLYPVQGALVNAVVAAEETISRGDALAPSATAGLLTIAAAGDAVVGVADQDAADGRVLCRIGAIRPPVLSL